MRPATIITDSPAPQFMPIDRDKNSPAVGASSPAAVDAVARATGAALQADTGRALAILSRVGADEFVGDELAFRSSMLERFGPNGSEDGLVGPVEPFAREMLAASRAYWRAALANPDERAAKEANLLPSLRRLTGRDDVANFDAIEPIVTECLGNAGYYCLQGLTGPLRELMLWTQQDLRSYKVVLPDGEHTTRVFLLDSFASLGWSDFATCGRRGTGGWATGDALFAVVPRYSGLDGEEFQVSFLGHETQHFADLTRFASMPQWELEYRAKLVELSKARLTRARVLRKLGEDQGDDPASPHAYANKRVLAALARRLHLPEGSNLDEIDVDRLQMEAAAELREDTRRRRATRPASATTARDAQTDQ